LVPLWNIAERDQRANGPGRPYHLVLYDCNGRRGRRPSPLRVHMEHHVAMVFMPILLEPE
jgi:hypothetical protein